jgi:SPP1 gp7 family putative phage head morphogenesis protein
MKRVVRRAESIVQTRNAGLLSPSIYAGTAYRQPWDRLTGIKEGHDREAIVAALTQAIASDASNVNELPIVAFALGTGENVTDISHYCYSLNIAASSSMSAVTFRQHLVNSLNYSGEAYILEINKTLTPLVGGYVEIMPAGLGSTNADGSPMLIAGYRVLAEDGQLRGTYDGEGKATGHGAIPTSMLHRVYIPHPENPLRANPPIAAAGLPVDILHYQRQATKSILVNDGMPAGVLSIQSPVDGAELEQNELDEAERKINKKASDSTRKGRILVLNASAQYQPLGQPSLTDGWVRVAENARAEILAVWRAPSSVLGMGGGRTYENQRVELSAYYSSTIVPVLNLICATINLQARRLGYVVSVDTSSVTALNESLDNIADRAAALVAAGITTVNEARELLGLEPIENGDSNPTTKPVLDETRGLPEEYSPLAKTSRAIDGETFSELLDTGTAQYEKDLEEYAQKFNERIQKMIIGGLRRKATRAADDQTPTPNIKVEDIVNTSARNDELVNDLTDLFQDASSTIGNITVDVLGVDVTEEMKTIWSEIGDQRLARLVTGSNDYPGWTQQICDDVNDAIQQAYKNGESVDGAITRIENLLGNNRGRAETIARTELSGLMNETSYKQMELSGVVSKKKWYSIGDNRTRDSHQRLNGKTVKFDEKFDVNGTAADGPHATNLPAGEVVNCRCRLIPIVD